MNTYQMNIASKVMGLAIGLVSYAVVNFLNSQNVCNLPAVGIALVVGFLISKVA